MDTNVAAGRLVDASPSRQFGDVRAFDVRHVIEGVADLFGKVDTTSGWIARTSQSMIMEGKNVEDSLNELATTVSIIECQITFLKRANFPLAVKLLEMTRLELLLNMNSISRPELESFCNQIREAVDQKR